MTSQAGLKLRQTMIEKYGSEEAWKEHLRTIGSKGGKVKSPSKGFGHIDSNPRAAGSLGGSISKRGKRVKA